MPHRILRTEDDRADLLRFLSGLDMPLTVEWRKGADRTLDQNALAWMWAGEAAVQYGDRDADDVFSDWKLRHGVPILRADSDSFRADYDAMIKPLPHEMKLRSMSQKGLAFPVTSRMGVKQMRRFLDGVSQECAEKGIRLAEPEP